MYFYFYFQALRHNLVIEGYQISSSYKLKVLCQLSDTFIILK